MKAMYYTNYGEPEVLHEVEISKPEIEENEVLIKIHATSVTSGDVRMRRGNRHSLPMWPVSKLAIGLFKPKKNLLGFEFSGTIEAIGNKVTRYQVGDEVFGLHSKGTYTEYIQKNEMGIMSIKPDKLTHEEAASILFGSTTAMFFLQKGNIENAKKVLVYGASGAVGVMVVQIAKFFGKEVTAVAGSKNQEFMIQLGADHVLDYTQEDYSKLNKSYDIVFDTVGKTKYSKVKHLLTENGVYLQTVFGFKKIFQMILTNVFSKRKIVCTISTETLEGLAFLKTRIENGEIKPIVDKIYSLKDIDKAHDYVEMGHKRGSVSIKV